MPDIQNYTINFGPQHPAAHGVLRMVLEMDGEVVQRADPHIGLLHRATEKLAESKTWLQALPYMDRLDYMSMLCSEHAYCLAVERMLGIEVPIRAQYIRVMFDEITRILSHLMFIGSHGLDVGALTMMLYACREREDLMDCYEAVSGSRWHAAYYRPGGVYRDVPDTMPQYKESKWKNGAKLKALNEARSGSLLDFLDDFVVRFPKRVDDYENLLTDNRIWKQRLVSVGVLPPERALQLGCSGAMLRGSGIAWDVRKKQPYAVYDQIDFDIPVGERRLLCPLSGARERNAPVDADYQAVRRLAACQSWPGDVQQPQGIAATPCQHEDEHGRSDPSLQAVQRGDSCSGRAGVFMRRALEGRIWRLSGFRWCQQALSLEGAFAVLHPLVDDE